VKILKVKFKILYNNGVEEAIVREMDEEKLEAIAEVINESFLSGTNAVVRLNDDNEAVFINIQQTSRVKIEYL
jgi:hypothetical protein